MIRVFNPLLVKQLFYLGNAVFNTTRGVKTKRLLGFAGTHAVVAYIVNTAIHYLQRGIGNKPGYPMGKVKNFYILAMEIKYPGVFGRKIICNGTSRIPNMQERPELVTAKYGELVSSHRFGRHRIHGQIESHS